MKVIVCLDDGNGMMFNNRRQSRDRVLIDDVIKTVDGFTLLIDKYSSLLFDGKSVALKISENMPEDAGESDWCFVENHPISDFAPKINQLVIYRWNREYPRDLVFDLDVEKIGLKLFSTEELAGYSHEKITKETYKK